MRLKNKKTGEIVPATNVVVGICKDGKWYDSLAKLNEEWKDYEELKELEDFWYIDTDGYVNCDSTITDLQDKNYEINYMKSIGNYFVTREEAEQAVEKLKAWKRLKDKGFRFTGVMDSFGQIGYLFPNAEDMFNNASIKTDLDLLFREVKNL